MIPLYRFRVSFEDHDDVSRDIDIRSDQTFLEFHHAIQQAIGFDGSKAASFFMSNDNWKKGQEIRSNNSNDSKGDFKPMESSRLCDFVADPHQKIYYVFDPAAQWSFYIELIRILPAGEKGKDYPTCVKVNGEAPKQYLVVDIPKDGVPDPENPEDALFADLLMDGEEEEEDLIGEEEEEESAEGLGDGVDEEEYDDIEESSDEDAERE
ncbi:MAG: IS1096 element passenger TnpR family protein [Bacteroidia bacterium]|jgi:hypothetical protein